MTRKILINGRREEELRVAIVDNQTLEDFEIETKSNGLLRNNIYRAVVSNIAPSLNAAFVDFGDVKNGFLAFNDVVESAYGKHVKDANKISDVLVPGQQLIVQVIKDATSLKGAQVTTNISLAGRYLVLRPKDAKSGISHKLDNDARADLTQKVRSLDLPEGYGCIVRTNAMDQSRAILLRDAKVLVQLWRKIEAEFAKGTGPQLLYNDQDIVVQVMRDYFDSTINEVLIDDKSCYERAKTYVRATIESSEDKVKLYEDKMPIFTRYGLEKQIERIYARMVSLPSGGFIVIDPTEALTAIDVNSAHATKRESQDLTAYHTNLEAAVEIGRQLRMRDIGGLIVVDFIDMKLGKHQRDVERVMRNAMARDKARIKVERISANGLLEINRQRLNQSLSQRTHLECPTCGGRGYIPSVEAIGMNLIREIDARAVGGDLGGVIIKLHPDIAQQVQNERRREFAQLELDYGIRIEIVASRDIGRGDESVEWLTKRQESELHPAKVSAPSADAASIIDVAEAYTSESDDDAYRPNDFEEFSSEEARKKRAAKRAARKEMQAAQETAEAADKDGRADPRAEARKSRAESKDARPDDKKVRADARHAEPKEAAAEAKDARSEGRDEKSAEPRTARKHGLPACVTGFIVLSGFIAQMQDYMNEEAREGGARSHRRFNIRSRHKSPHVEPKSIQTDYRFFALDVARAVSVQWFDLPQDAPKKDVIARFEEVSQWLMLTTRQPKEEIENRADILRNKMLSRHASARLDCLFDDACENPADELARMLMEERDAVLGNSKKLDEAIIRALNGNLKARCARVFAKEAEPEQPKAVGGVNMNAFSQEEIDDMLEAMSEDILSHRDEQNAEEKPVTRERRRHSRRGSIGEAETSVDRAVSVDASSDVETDAREPMSEKSEPSDNGGVQLAVDQIKSRSRSRRTRRRAIGEPALSPFTGDNGEVILADVPILPMTVTEDEDSAADSDADDTLAQAITQELPAVTTPRRERRERRTRRTRESMLEQADTPKSNTEAVPEAPAPEMRETAAPAAEEDLSDIDTSEMLPRVERRETRRVRKTRDRRAARDQEIAAAPVQPAAEPVQPAAVPEPAAYEAAEPALPVVNAVLDDRPSAHKPRERRRTERAHIGAEPAPREVAVPAEQPVEAPAVEQKATPVVPPVTVAAADAEPVRRRVRKTRVTRDPEAAVTEQPADPVVEKAAPQAEVPAEGQKRRVRRTRRNLEQASGQALTPEVPQTAAAEPAEPAEQGAAPRRVRRTRRSSIE